jgi:hypothetical protein
MKILLILICISICMLNSAQSNTNELQNIIRVNAISPGIEVEIPFCNKSTLSVNTGIGVSGSYMNLSYVNSGWTYFIAPFMDLSYKRFYNLNSRIAKGKSISGNSGNYWSIRLLTNFDEIKSYNVTRKDNIDFAVGPTWGIQRSKGNFHMLFDIGPVYYFDTIGNHGFFPIAIQLNIGYNLKRW